MQPSFAPRTEGDLRPDGPGLWWCGRDPAGRSPMRALVTAAIIALATTAASAQSMNILQDKKRMVTGEEVKAQQERDSAYKPAISKMPSHKPATDPWGKIREPGAPAPHPVARA